MNFLKYSQYILSSFYVKYLKLHPAYNCLQYEFELLSPLSTCE